LKEKVSIIESMLLNNGIKFTGPNTPDIKRYARYYVCYEFYKD
jgi:hypothetical protein